MPLFAAINLIVVGSIFISEVFFPSCWLLLVLFLLLVALVVLLSLDIRLAYEGKATVRSRDASRF